MASRKTPLATFETPFDVYQAWSVIGEGGAGKVYAVTRSDGTEYALKLFVRKSALRTDGRGLRMKSIS